jgi:hypothetical protein
MARYSTHRCWDCANTERRRRRLDGQWRWTPRQSPVWVRSIGLCSYGRSSSELGLCSGTTQLQCYASQLTNVIVLHLLQPLLLCYQLKSVDFFVWLCYFFLDLVSALSSQLVCYLAHLFECKISEFNKVSLPLGYLCITAIFVAKLEFRFHCLEMTDTGKTLNPWKNVFGLRKAVQMNVFQQQSCFW